MITETALLPVRKPLVYVAGPYSSDPVTNTRHATQEGMRLWRTGLVGVVIPHLTFLADLVQPMSVDDWYAFDLDLLDHCNAVLRLPGQSAGATAEVDHARRRGIPVFEHQAEVLAWVLAARTATP